MPDPIPPEAIYAAARQAGFSPDQAVTMTAIALAESGGNPGAHATSGEDSRGLWQINLSPQANGNAPWAQTLNLFDPVDNARAAWEVSRHGADIGPWTVTHSDRGSRYLEFQDEAMAAALANGETASGNFAGPANYDSPDVPAGLPGDMPPPPMPDFDDVADGPGDINRFLEIALAQSGDRYEMGVTASADDADPDVFDCSELVEWAAAQVDVDVNTASYLQYLDMKNAGSTIDVQRAIDTPGALLFTFSSEPVPGGGRPPKAHVAISLGDGRVIEARSTRDGVGVFNAGDRFNYAALIPGMDYSSAGIPDFDPGAPPSMPVPPMTPAPPDPLAEAELNAGGVDTDVDMLPDHFEIKYGLSPDQADTDGDGITDGYELIVLGTKATLIDSDFDGISDDVELALGLDPTIADNPDPNAGMFVPDDMLADTDGDGVADWGEMLSGTNADDPDTDDDGMLDGDELMFGDVPSQGPDDDDAFDDDTFDDAAL
jgi:Lysozyme like domain/NlpC/P60 family